MKGISALIFSLIILLVGFGLSACERSDRVEAARESDSLDDRQLTEEDKDFVLYASEMHVGEIDLAKQAKEKSMNKDVDEYADAVIRGHSDALEHLREQEIASVSSTASLDTKYHADFLSDLSGAEFDRQFLDLMIADHEDASNTFREHLNAGRNKGVKDHLEEVLPSLENLLQEARDVQHKLKPQGSTTN